MRNGGNVLDKKGTCGALLTDFSKAFDCLPHKVLLAKLNEYGFDESSLKYIKKLRDQKQRVKINNSFSYWTNTLYVVPQGSILAPLLFNILLCDLFLYNIDIANYADDNIPYAMNKPTADIKMVSEWLFTWFQNKAVKQKH